MVERGFENALMDMLTDEDFYKELTERVMDNYIAMLKVCDDVLPMLTCSHDWGDQRGVIMGKNTWVKFMCHAGSAFIKKFTAGKEGYQHS